MYKRKFMVRTLCAFLCALLLSLSVAGSCTMTVEAAGFYIWDYGFNHMLDMALSKRGVAMSPYALEDLADLSYDALELFVNDYILYCARNGYLVTEDSWLEYANYVIDNSDDYSLYDYWLAQYYIADGSDLYVYWKDYNDFLSAYRENHYEEEELPSDYEEAEIDEDTVLALLGLADIVKDKIYTISSDIVNWVSSLFEENQEELTDFYYIPTYGPDDVPATYFDTGTTYSSFKQALATAGDDIMVVYGNFTNSTLKSNIIKYCPDFLGLVTSNVSSTASYDYAVTAYNSNWTTCTIYTMNSAKYAYTTVEEYIEGGTTTSANYFIMEVASTSSRDLCICTSDGRNLPVFKDLDALKSYSAGQASYYTTTSYFDYSTTDDNSITVSGDYIITYGSTYTYDTITETNDFSQENIDNSVTNTTYKYYYGTVDDDSDDDDDSGDGVWATLWSALEVIINAITEFVSFLITLLGEAISLISGFLTDALSLLSGLTDIFGGFTDLLGEMFAFIPDEVIDAISSGIVLIVILGVVRGLRG